MQSSNTCRGVYYLSHCQSSFICPLVIYIQYIRVKVYGEMTLIKKLKKRMKNQGGYDYVWQDYPKSIEPDEVNTMSKCCLTLSVRFFFYSHYLWYYWAVSGVTENEEKEHNCRTDQSTFSEPSQLPTHQFQRKTVDVPADSKWLNFSQCTVLRSDLSRCHYTCVPLSSNPAVFI